MIHLQNAKVLTWSSTDTTVGACGLLSIVAVGSADASTLTIKDGTATKLVLPISTTATVNVMVPQPAGFTNLITDMTGTASYTIFFVPRP